MNSQFFVMWNIRRFTCCALLALHATDTPLVRAQSPQVPSSASANAHAAIIRQTLADSTPLFAAGNFTQAEQVLFSANTAHADTSAWNLESARRLYDIGLYFRFRNTVPASQQIAARALAQVDVAVARARAARDTKEESRARQLAGEIHDRLLGNRRTALESFQEAVRLNPGAKFAADQANRLTKMAEEVGRHAARK